MWKPPTVADHQEDVRTTGSPSTGHVAFLTVIATVVVLVALAVTAVVVARGPSRRDPEVATDPDEEAPPETRTWPLPSLSANRGWAAAREDAALVVTAAGPDFRDAGAGVVTATGVVNEIEVPVNGDGVLVPLATSEGFALFWQECEPIPDVVEGCATVTGSVAFYDPSGVLRSVRSTQPVPGESLQPIAGPGDSVILASTEAWLVTPDSVEQLPPGPTGSICGIPDAGVFSTEFVGEDPAAPEDTLDGFAIIGLDDDTWRQLAEVPDGDGGALFPFCTTGGIVVEDQVFDGERLVPLVLDDGSEVSDRSVVGITRSGRILEANPQVDGSTLDERGGWLALDRDRTKALRASPKGWELVDVE